MNFPNINSAQLLTEGLRKRLFIGAYGFEERSIGWADFQNKKGSKKILSKAILIKYEPKKGNNRVEPLRKCLGKIGIVSPEELEFNYLPIDDIEVRLSKSMKNINDFEEIILDITALTKYLILVILCNLRNYNGTLRIVYSEAKTYAPTLSIFEKFKKNPKTNTILTSKFPSQGFGTILRAKCLSSIRMQGQPVCLVALTSFNELLIRHMLGTISPYRLIFINGSPPRKDFKWREFATQHIHNKLIQEYSAFNEIDAETGLLKRVSSTFYYKETFVELEKIYDLFGMYERIIVAATGSKMQTVGLFFFKMKHEDIHIEYPNPDSYFFKGMSTGVKEVHEIIFENLSAFITNLNPIEQHM
jgi:hypothetical protein